MAALLSASLLAQSAQELYQRALGAEHATGDLRQAIALYTRVVAAAGKDRALAARALMRVAGAHEKLGQHADAIATYAELLRAFPEQRTEATAAQERLTALRRSPRTETRPTQLAATGGVSSAIRPLFESYCVGCHTGSRSAVDLDALARSPFAGNLPLWEKVTRRLRARLDPPGGAPRPDDATYRTAVRRLEAALDAAYAADRTALPADAVDGVELAARIATFLWNIVPDTALLDAARRGDLRDGPALSRQVTRMLRDPRSGHLIDRFFTGWLSLDRVAKAQPDAAVYPQFDADLREAMATESRLFLQSQLREDRDAFELWTAGYTYVNERLARHYGIAGVTGPAFIRVTWPNAIRGGLLGQSGLLTALSQPSRTSPTARGVYVLTRVMGLEAPPPPANVPALAEGGQRGTLRLRMSAHKLNPACANCHATFDPLGLALENFDAIGAWRTSDGGMAIDASGAFLDGSRFEGPAQFRAGLAKYRDAYYEGVTRQLLAFALNRRGKGGRVYDYEMPAVRKIVREAAANGYRWSSLFTGIVASAPFQAKSVVP
jgi:hypothetical protein